MDMDMKFSDPVNVTVFAWSPDGLFLARVVHNRILIENTKDSSLLHSEILPGRIDHVEWSSDSSYVGCASYCGGFVQIFSVDQPHWRCKIDHGSDDFGVGLQDFTWSPNARDILTTASHFVQLTVWSIHHKSVVHIRDILPISGNKSFSGGGKILAIAEFDENYTTCISLYSTKDWKKTISFPVICKDLEEVCWCPNDTSILLRDSTLFCGLYIYSPEGELLKHYSPDGLSVGIPLALWSPTGQFLVSFNHHNMLRILNGLTYGLLIEEKLDHNIQRYYPNCQLYNEVVQQTFSGLGMNSYERETDILIIPGTPTENIKQSTKIKFSWDGKFMAIVADCFSTTLWIWDLTRASLVAILVHLTSITDFDWDPIEIRLCLCTGRDSICFWTPYKCWVKPIYVSAGNNLFRCTGIKWNPYQQPPSLALTSKDDKLIVCNMSSRMITVL